MAIRKWHGGKIILLWLGVAALWLGLRVVLPDYNVFTQMWNTQRQIEAYSETVALKHKIDSLRSEYLRYDSLMRSGGALVFEERDFYTAMAADIAEEHDSLVKLIRTQNDVAEAHPGYTNRQVTLAWLLIAVLPAGFVTWRWLSAQEEQTASSRQVGDTEGQ